MSLDAKLLIVGTASAHRSFIRAALSDAGWAVSDAENGMEASAAIATEPFALVLLDVTMGRLDGLATARALRERGHAMLPIMALTADPAPEWSSRLSPADMDGYIVTPCAADALVESVRPWWPEQGGAVRATLSSVFGQAEYMTLLSRFRGELLEALSRIDEPTGCRDRAHRIGGLAGTIGFRAVSGPWLAISDGDDSAAAPARIAARKALMAIDRETGVLPRSLDPGLIPGPTEP